MAKKVQPNTTGGGGKRSAGNQRTTSTRTPERRDAYGYPTTGKRSWNQGGAGYGGTADVYRGIQQGRPITQSGYSAFAAGLANPDSLLPPIGPGNPISSGPGGGRYGGGGGGGGGGSAMTQAMFDQMVAALGRQGPALNLPAFQGTNIAAFNAAPYTQAQNSLNQAVAADTANVNANAQNTTNALNTNFRNDYANATVTPGATQAPVGAALQGTAGPVASNDPNQQAAAGANADNANSQAAFSNLLQVLAANANQSQQSRLGQVQMDKGSALNQIGAQNLGLGAGINQARAGAQNQWSQQDNERRYQNSLMAQQWQREQGQANWTQRNQQMQTILQPILDLIASTGGTKINTAALTALLNRQ
jgi:hypothetical protein